MTTTQTSGKETCVRGWHRPVSSEIATPDQLIVVLHQNFPRDDKITANIRFVQTVVDQGLFHKELAEAYHALRYNSLTQKAKSRAKLDAEALAHRAKVKAKMAQKINLNVSILGKKLREWTGNQLVDLGGTFAILGTHCGSKKVGNVFTPQTLKAFLSEAAKS